MAEATWRPIPALGWCQVSASAVTSNLTGAAKIAYTSRFSRQPAGASISSQFLTCCVFALLIFIGSLAHAELVPEATTDAGSAVEAVTATATPAATLIDVWEGKVSYLARKFTGHKTASGERFDPNALTIAHKTLPFGTLVRVTNLRNGKSVQARVNDRGPFTADRMADLSLAAARQIDMLRTGVAHVRLEIVSAFD